MLRSGAIQGPFDSVYAPSTIGTLLREFIFGHAHRPESVLGAHLAPLCERVALLSATGTTIQGGDHSPA